MSDAEMRKAKANLHKVIIDEILSYGGTLQEDAKMYSYIIELATCELMNCIREVKHNDD